MLADQRTKIIFRDTASLGHARNLELSGRRGDIGIEARPGGCDQINWNRRARVLSLQRSDVALHALDQLLIRGSKIRSTRAGSVVSIAGGGWPAMKIAGARERLANDA